MDGFVALTVTQSISWIIDILSWSSRHNLFSSFSKLFLDSLCTRTCRNLWTFWRYTPRTVRNVAIFAVRADPCTEMTEAIISNLATVSSDSPKAINCFRFNSSVSDDRTMSQDCRGTRTKASCVASTSKNRTCVSKAAPSEDIPKFVDTVFRNSVAKSFLDGNLVEPSGPFVDDGVDSFCARNAATVGCRTSSEYSTFTSSHLVLWRTILESERTKRR